MPVEFILMTYKSWREAVKALAFATVPATPAQLELGRHTNIQISRHLPKIITAAMLRLALAEVLNLEPPHQISDRHKELLQTLQRATDPPISPETEEEAVAWIIYLRLMRRRESLADLELNEGDVVETMMGDLAKVSSIGEDGRIYFKGGLGFGAWPDQITIKARKDDVSDAATEFRQQAENMAALRRTRSAWSSAKRQDLSEFIVEKMVTEDDIVELEAVITAAEDERPIQKFLEENRHLLTELLGGHDRVCLPQKKLGAEYVPDFIIGDADSLGIRWVLIELETPKSGIYLTDGSQFDEKARKGVSQIAEWRNWLAPNIGYARRRRADNGLGLFDIREKSEAIVLVGRRSQMPKTKDAQRFEFRLSNNIQIHTYDWLLDQLRSVIRFQGPWGANPYIIPKEW
jgi:hypothetical protein